jgi:hypothetical protein
LSKPCHVLWSCPFLFLVENWFSQIKSFIILLIVHIDGLVGTGIIYIHECFILAICLSVWICLFDQIVSFNRVIFTQCFYFSIFIISILRAVLAWKLVFSLNFVLRIKIGAIFIHFLSFQHRHAFFLLLWKIL